MQKILFLFLIIYLSQASSFPRSQEYYQYCYNHLKSINFENGDKLIKTTSTSTSNGHIVEFHSHFQPPYEFDGECLQIQILFNNIELSQGENSSLNQWQFNQNSQEIQWKILNSDFSAQYGCEKGSDGEYIFISCPFKINLLFWGQAQVSVLQKLQLLIQKYTQKTLIPQIYQQPFEENCCQNPLNIQTDIYFCSDIHCETLLNETDLQYQRNQDIFILQKILSPEYQHYHLNQLSVQLDEYNPNIITYSNSQPGHLIIHIKSQLAKKYMDLKIISQLQRPNRSFLQQQQDEDPLDILNSSRYNVISQTQISISEAKKQRISSSLTNIEDDEIRVLADHDSKEQNGSYISIKLLLLFLFLLSFIYILIKVIKSLSKKHLKKSNKHLSKQASLQTDSELLESQSSKN